jgi:hypothetical protein
VNFGQFRNIVYNPDALSRVLNTTPLYVEDTTPVEEFAGGDKDGGEATSDDIRVGGFRPYLHGF